MKCKNCGRENSPGAVFCINCGARLNPEAALVPGVGSSFGHGWRTLWRNFWELVLAGVVYMALWIPIAVVLGLVLFFTTGELVSFSARLPGNYITTMGWEFQLASGIISIVYYTPIAFGLMFVYLGAVRGEKVKFGNIFAAFQNYHGVLLVGVLYIIVFGGVAFLLAFIADYVPVLGILLSLAWTIFSIIIYCKLAFVPYLLLDRKLKAVEAIRISWNMSGGHAGKVFVIGLLAGLMFVAVAIISFIVSLIFFWVPFVGIFFGILVGVIGGIIIGMWALTTYGSLYYAVSASVAKLQPSLSGAPPPPAA